MNRNFYIRNFYSSILKEYRILVYNQNSTIKKIPVQCCIYMNMRLGSEIFTSNDNLSNKISKLLKTVA